MSDANTTVVVELVVVGMALALGLVLLTQTWPHPDLPLWYVSAATGAFFVYASVAAVRDLSRLLRQSPHQSTHPPAHGEVDADLSGWLSDETRAPEPTQADPASASPPARHAEASTGAQGLVIGAPSSDPTSLYSLEELRPESDDDFALDEKAGVPLFAESALFDLKHLQQGARALEGDAARDDPFEQPTELHSLEALRPETDDDLTDKGDEPAALLFAESALYDQQKLARMAEKIQAQKEQAQKTPDQKTPVKQPAMAEREEQG